MLISESTLYSVPDDIAHLFIPQITVDFNVYNYAFQHRCSTIHTTRLQLWLDGYPSELELDLIDSLENGIVIPSDLHKVYSDSVPSNHRSAVEAHVLVTQKLAKEIRLNRVAGPFKF